MALLTTVELMQSVTSTC